MQPDALYAHRRLMVPLFLPLSPSNTNSLKESDRIEKRRRSIVEIRLARRLAIRDGVRDKLSFVERT